MSETPVDKLEEYSSLTYKTAKARRAIKSSELVFILFFAIVVIALTVMLINKLNLRHDTASARVVSDAVITDIQMRDGTKARALGSAIFQKTYSAASLTQEFRQITIATLKPPILAQQTVVDSSLGRTVFFTYKYTALKVPYYLRTSILHENGAWQLTSITGSANESQLLIN